MNMLLKDKIAVISGVGDRFGKATAYLFAQEGATVILVSRKKDIVESIVNDIRKIGGKADYRLFDATNASDAEKKMNDIAKDYGRIDILFNNAGGYYTKKQKIHEMDEVFWDNVLKNNLGSIFVMSRSAIPIMKKNKGGSIINVSAADKTLLDANSAYAAAKGGIIELTKNVAREVREHNIRVNCIRPGVIRNVYNSDNLAHPPAELIRKGNSEDVAHAALYFASQQSSWVSGQTLVVDGGESLFIDGE